jgi:hypothetical protein
MKKGELDAEPENSLGKHDTTQKTPPTFDSLGDHEDDPEEEVGAFVKVKSDGTAKGNTKPTPRNPGEPRKKHKGKHAPPASSKNLTVERDDFFGSD